MSDSVWGPLLDDITSYLPNYWGCVALLTHDTTCVARVYERDRCLSRCALASDKDTCESIASADACQPHIDSAKGCEDKLALGDPSSPAATCLAGNSYNARRSVVKAFCGQ